MASLFKKEGSHTESVRTQTWSGCSEKGGARDGPVGYREQLLASILPSKDPYSGLGYSRSHTALDQPVPKLNPLVRARPPSRAPLGVPRPMGRLCRALPDRAHRSPAGRWAGRFRQGGEEGIHGRQGVSPPGQ